MATVLALTPEPAQTDKGIRNSRSKGKIWIDLDNSPHVPIFVPIIEELKKRNYSIVLTARDCFQVREMADLFHLNYRLIGHHSGKSKIRKIAGLCARALHLIPLILKEKPELALSVCSRSQLIVSSVLRLRTFMLGDYEYAKGWAIVQPTWVMCPEVIPKSALAIPRERIFQFPGIKEDIYVPRFVPDPRLRSELGLREDDIVVTLRPPAREAHYHVPESDVLFESAVDFLSKFPAVKMVVLPRNDKQATELLKRWPVLFAKGAIRIPAHVLDGLNLIWFSDLVISGGGTMNREAAALGVPVYSVFRGKIGAVDHYLSETGRLVLLESVEDVQTKIAVTRRARPNNPAKRSDAILQDIVNQITAVMGSRCPAPKVRSDVGPRQHVPVP